MKSAIALLIFALALGRVGDASAADHVCSGQAKGKGEVGVFIITDEAGRVSARHATWIPQGMLNSAKPGIVLGYDLEGDHLGAPSSVWVSDVISVEPRPRSAKADMVVSIGDRSWRRPWLTYARNMDDLRSGRVPTGLPKGARNAFFYGLVPIVVAKSTAGDIASADLLPMIANAAVVRVSVIGDDADERLGDNSFDLSDTVARNALFIQALADANRALLNPTSCLVRPQT